MGYTPPEWFREAIHVFGTASRAKLASGVGEPEEALRAPVEQLVTTVGQRMGLRVVPVGESMLSDLRVRPDYAIQVDGAVCGYIEIKKPGLGANAEALTGKHNREQWKRLSNLPNLIYTDGVSWAHYSVGARDRDVVRLVGTLNEGSGALQVDGPELEQMLATFLRWQPAPLRNVHAMVRAIAPLCRLLRDEVVDQLRRERQQVDQGAPSDSQPFTGLAKDWRGLLFPSATDDEFADGYAQTVTFALLLARSRNISFTEKSMHDIGSELGAEHSLMGRALQLLTDHVARPFRVTLSTLQRVVAAADWDRIRAGKRDAYLYLYEEFLEVYDNDLRKTSGSYYTPVDVAEHMVRLTDDVVRDKLGMRHGLGSENVTVVDPAAGTGTFLLRIVDQVFQRVAARHGEGEAREIIADLARRIIGFEMQMGPHAVSELRVNDLLQKLGVSVPPEGGVSLYVTNTLDDPQHEQPPLSWALAPISASATAANRIKADVPVTVVIGNPPYRERAKGLGSWVEQGSPPDRPSLMRAFALPGNGRNEYVLKNLAWYFWRWATWKVFDADPGANSRGVVAFITTSAYLRGTGHKGMRSYLRRMCDEGWIIDVTPEGMQPEVATRLFPGVQQPLAIGIFVRSATESDAPAVVHYTAIHGRRQDKFEALSKLRIDGAGWQTARNGWTDPFTPAGEDGWDNYPALNDLFPVTAPGVKTNRGWVYAPRLETLRARWTRLVTENDLARRAELFKETRDRTLSSRPPALPYRQRADRPLVAELDPCPEPIRVLYRSFDRQWLIPDNRVIDYARAGLWAAVQVPGQVFLVEMHSKPIRSGPGISLSNLLPDMDAFKGSEGGRALPTRHGDGTPTTPRRLLELLGERLGMAVSGDDLVCYVAAVAAYGGYAGRFAAQLKTPGVRVPLTTDPSLWQKALELGREVVWLHTYGERLADPEGGRPHGEVNLPAERQPKNLDGIQTMPSTIRHSSEDPSTSDDDVLYVDDARFQPVSAAVWRYDVGEKQVVKQWFAHRRRKPGGRISSDLDHITAETWTRQDTVELRQLLTVLQRLVDLEPDQAELLDAICDGPLLSTTDLNATGILPIDGKQRKLRQAIADLFTEDV
jgi:hypothetical protein